MQELDAQVSLLFSYLSNIQSQKNAAVFAAQPSVFSGSINRRTSGEFLTRRSRESRSRAQVGR